MTPKRSAKVITLSKEPDAAKRLRQAWGAAIRETREALGLSQADLVERMKPEIDITPQAVGMWERGETSPKPHHQVAVARALGVPHSRLFAITDEVA